MRIRYPACKDLNCKKTDKKGLVAMSLYYYTMGGWDCLAPPREADMDRQIGYKFEHLRKYETNCLKRSYFE
jgi:hypothetical protein